MKTKLICLMALVLFLPSLAPAEVKLTKSADRSTAKPGDTITYTIRYLNTGTSDATNLVINDPIPAGTHFVSGSQRFTSGSGTTSYNPDTNAVTFTVSSPLGPGQNGSTQFQVTVDWTITGFSFDDNTIAPYLDSQGRFASSGDYWGMTVDNNNNIVMGGNDSLGFLQDDGSRNGHWPCHSYDPNGGDTANVQVHQLTGTPSTLQGVTEQCLQVDHPPEYSGVNLWDSGSLIQVSNQYIWSATSYEPNHPIYATLMQSADLQRWTPSPPLHLGSGTFSTSAPNPDILDIPSFVQYGRNPTTASTDGDPSWPDGGDKYVYATTNDGDNMSMMRCPRDRIANLNRADWQKLVNYTADARGHRTPVWAPMDSQSQIKSIFGVAGGNSDLGGKVGGYIAWAAPIRKYMLIWFYFPDTCDLHYNEFDWQNWCEGHTDTDPGSYTRITQWLMFSADQAWGPWTRVPGEYRTGPPQHVNVNGVDHVINGLYSPTFVTKFMDQQVSRDSNGAFMNIWVISSGGWTTAPGPFNCNGYDKPDDCWYGINPVKMTLRLR